MKSVTERHNPDWSRFDVLPGPRLPEPFLFTFDHRQEPKNVQALAPEDELRFTMPKKGEKLIAPVVVLPRLGLRVVPPIGVNVRKTIIDQVSAIEAQLCGLEAVLSTQLALSDRIADESEKATDPNEKAMLERRLTAQNGVVRNLRAHQAALRKKAIDLRRALANLTPPVLLGDPCDLYDRTEDVPVDRPPQGWYGS